MTRADFVEVGKELASITRDKIAAVLSEFTPRLKAIEERVTQIKDGEPGAAGPPGAEGQPGPQGLHGVKGDAGEVGPSGLEGAKGDRGDPGEQGSAGAPGPAGIQGLKGELGERGSQGEPGSTGQQGSPGPQGEKGDRGDAGASVSVNDIRDFLEAETAKWALEFERRATDQLTRFLERIPAPKDGADGRDGLGFEDISVDHDGERTFSFVGRRGDLVKTLGSGVVPAVIDRGVYQAGKTYDKGDGATWAGSFWIAQEQTSAKPGESGALARAWRLAVKRGSEGRTGAVGPAGPKGDQGDQGAQVVQRW